MKLFWLEFQFALRNILRQRRRTAIAVGSVTFGVISLILASGFINWMLLEFRELTVKSQLGHLQIVRPNFYAIGKSDPFSYLLPISYPKLGLSEHQIKAISPRISFSGFISLNESTISFIGDGVDPQEEEKFGNALLISSGQNLSINDPHGIIIGEGLARNLGVKVGDQVVILSSTAMRSINAVEVKVLGLFSTVSKTYDDMALRMPIDTARKLLRVQGSHIWVILLNDIDETNRALVNLRNTLPESEFEIIPWYKLADYYNKTIALFEKQIQGIKIIIASIILLSISNTLTLNVMEQIGQIGTAMALGIKRFGIMRLFLIQGVLIGCVGSLIGLIISILLANIISSIGIPMPPPPSMARGYVGEILITWNLVAEALILAIGTTLIASLYPAWKATRMQIVDALRHNR